MNNAGILVLDFGSQYTQLIARRLRDCGIYAEIVPYFEKLDSIKAKHPKGIILSGGPASIYEEGAYKPDAGIFDLNIPILGVCYGMQYIADFFGGRVIRAEAQEFGKAVLEIYNPSLEFSLMQKQDIDAMLSLWEDSVRASHHFLNESEIKTIAQDLLDACQHLEHIIIARALGEMVGFIGMQTSNQTAMIEMLFVAPKMFGKGVGKALLKEAYLRVLKHSKIIAVDCNEQNPKGNQFYEKVGFQKVGRSDRDSQGREYPIVHFEITNEALSQSLMKEDPKLLLFEGIKQDSIVWMSHADKVEKIPEGFIELAKSGNTHYCAIAHLKKQIYALQFHPEVIHSECGDKILQNFALNICKCQNHWNMHHFAEIEIKKLKETIGEERVICAVSGGVDSSVVATLLHRAIGDLVIPVFVDTGLLRKNERQEIEKLFLENLKVPLIVRDASELFLSRLKNVIDPEQKRKIIGETFIEVFEDEAKKHNAQGRIKFLAQGTLYPDVIESISIKGPSKTIKSHHNVGGLPEWMKFELIEPLRELFKDEVRALGRELGMPETMLMRHPFPGPGLAIRIMGEVNELDLNLLREADSIFIEELYKNGLYDKVWQAFCVLLNVRSVGVMGDNRTYDNTICLRAVEAMDGMTASFSHLPHELLESVSNRIINEVQGINRVVYDITSKPPGTIEWE